jgi:hypothetical protein
MSPAILIIWASIYTSTSVELPNMEMCERERAKIATQMPAMTTLCINRR